MGWTGGGAVSTVLDTLSRLGGGGPPGGGGGGGDNAPQCAIHIATVSFSDSLDFTPSLMSTSSTLFPFFESDE